MSNFFLLNQQENRIEKNYVCDSLIDYYVVGHLKKQYYFTYLLGYCYEFGIGVEEDNALAKKYYSIAAENGIKEAMRALGLMHLQNNDIVNAVSYLTKAYGNNDKLAGFKLGQIYFDGKYVKKDYNNAVNYFNNTKEIKSSLYMLAECYYYGNGVDIDYQKALDYYEKSGYIKAYYMIGLIYHKHLNDYDNAIKYYNKALKYDDERANLNLGICYYEINDYDNALKLLEPLANNGNLEAKKYINEINENFRTNYC